MGRLGLVLLGLLGLVALEQLVLRWRRREVFSGDYTREVWLNIGCGLGQVATRMLYEPALAVSYLWLYRHAPGVRWPFTLSPRAPAAWLAVLLVTDAIDDGYHRLAHRVPALWSLHVVHHQTPIYDLSVSLRLSWFSGPIERAFYLPLALLGVPPEMVLAALGLSSFYQFFVHTRLVGRLGSLEWVFNTPSNHRVHHGTEARYLHHNFAGIFVIWDRLFGTYEPEGAEPSYGSGRPLGSFNPLWANLWPIRDWLRGR